MSFVGIIPKRLRPIAEQIAAEYTTGMSYESLAYQYKTNKTAISSIVRRYSAPRPCYRHAKPKRATIGGYTKEVLDLKATRILCSAAHLRRPRPCVMHDYKDSCVYCASTYRRSAGIAGSSMSALMSFWGSV